MISLRRRLVALIVLAAVACVGAFAAIASLAATGVRQRTERAEERVSREVELLRDADDEGHAPRRRTPRVLSGYLDVVGRDTAGPPVALLRPVRALRDEAVDEARRTGATALRVVDDVAPLRRGRAGVEGSGALVIAVTPLRRDGYAWAGTWVPRPRAEPLWRGGAAALALATLCLVAVALHTTMALRRGAARLDATLRALGGDLAAPVQRPDVEELATVSDGIAGLAEALSAAQGERERLTQELAARERLASLGRVVAGVAHEVRNPMAAMKLRIDLARRSLLSVRPDHAGVAADLTEMGDEIARLDRLVVDLLTVSGRRTGPRVEVDLHALAAQRAEALAALTASRGVRIVVRGEARAWVDRDGLTRALDNLLRNAAEASPDGAEVAVELARRGDEAWLRVVDAGPGVEAAREAELFEPFFTTKPGGTGLGLALSRAVAEAHGGGLRYRREGARTVFELTLPAGAASGA